jgi:hypothetical protein
MKHKQNSENDSFIWKRRVTNLVLLFFFSAANAFVALAATEKRRGLRERSSNPVPGIQHKI